MKTFYDYEAPYISCQQTVSTQSCMYRLMFFWGGLGDNTRFGREILLLKFPC